VNLSFLYHGIGNQDLRDKAVDTAIAAGVTNEVLVMLRRLQGRIAEVPPTVIEEELARLEESGEYRGLAVVHEDLGQYREAAQVYLRGLAADLADLKDFTLAHHLKELVETEVIPGLFVQALQQAADADDLWWQVRALEELGWTTELEALVLDSEYQVDSDPELGDGQRAHLRMIAAQARGDEEGFRGARGDLELIEATTDWNT